MADSAPIYDPDKKAAVTRPDLQALEGGGETSPPTGNLSAAREPTDLAQKEAGRGDSFYKKSGEESPTKTGRLSLRGHLSRRRLILGGGIVGTIITILGFTLVSGPLQFIHIAKLLEQFHFSTQQSQQDNRFMHEVRYLRYMSKGDAARARMGFVGNYFTNRFEAKIANSGLISRYSPKAGKAIGFEVDTTSENSPYKGMSPEEARAAVKVATGLDVTTYDGSFGDIGTLKKGDLLLETPKTFIAALKFNNAVLQSAGYAKLSAVMGTRLFCLRAGCSLHPLVSLASKTKAAAEKEFNKRQQDKIANGETAPDVTAKSEPSSNGTPDEQKAATQNANNASAAAEQAKKEGAAAGIAAKSGDSTSVPGYAAKLKGELGTGEQLKAGAIGGTVILGVACILRQMDSDAGRIKQAQVILPAERMGADAISLGSQVESGKGVDPTQLGFYAQLLTGVDQNGNKTSWFNANSIQAELGNPSNNPKTAADATLVNAANDKTPFSALNQSPASIALNPLCSGPGQLITGIAGFFGAKLVDLALLPVQAILVGQLEPVVAHWLAGQAINPLAVGADYGNTVNYGAALAANDQAMAAGGVALTTNQTAYLKSIGNAQYQQQFKSQGILARLFDASDSRSVLGKLIDRGTPSVSQNFAKMGSAFLDFGHIFSSIGSLFSANARAATTSPYDYGFSQIGFSAEDMNNPMFENPFENACYVVGCPDKNIAGFLVDSDNAVTPAGQSYIDRASKCFGVTLSQESVDTPDGIQMQWGVTSAPGAAPIYSTIPADCSSHTDPDWLRLRFFILDTETMNSMGCYEGDNQACNDIGFASSSSSQSSASSGVGTYLNPFRDVQKNGSLVPERIDQGVDYAGTGPVYALGNGTVVNVNAPAGSGWGPNNIFISYTLSDGPAGGKTVFVAECMDPAVTVGQQVTPNTVIGQMTNCGSGIETGWAQGSGDLTLAHDCFDNTDSTTYGVNFSDLLQSLGAPPGIIKGSLTCTTSTGLPTW